MRPSALGEAHGDSTRTTSWKLVVEEILRAVASSSSIAAFRRLLCFQSPQWSARVKAKRQRASGLGSPVPEPRARPGEDLGESRVEGNDFGGRTSGMLDEAMGLMTDAVLLHSAIANKVRRRKSAAHIRFISPSVLRALVVSSSYPT